MHSFLRISLSCLGLVIAAGCSDKADLAKELSGRASLGDLGAAPCANVDIRIERTPQIAGIEPDFLPGAARIRRVLDPAGGNFDRPVLEFLGGAGILRTTDGLVDGKKAKEYELTPKGYLAIEPGRAQCFAFQKIARVELLKVDSSAVPDGAYGGAKVARVTYRAHYETVAPWAKSDEFEAVFRPKDPRSRSLAESNAVGEDQSILMVKRDGKWWLDREAGAMLQLAKLPPAQAAAQQKFVEGLHPAARSLFLSRDLRPLVMDAVEKAGDACFSFSQRALTIRLGNQEGADLQALLVTRHGTGTSAEERQQAADFIARVKAAGLVVREEPVDGDAGIRYYFHESLRGAYSPNTGCLSVGKPNVADVALFQPRPGGIVPYRVWLKVANPPAHAKALAAHFPNLRVMLELGYGAQGQVIAESDQNRWVQNEVPKFSALAPLEPMKPAADNVTPATIVGAESTAVATAPLQFTSHDRSCLIPPDGREVGHQSSNSRCMYAHTQPRITTGRVYTEIKFATSARENQLDSWTKLSLVNERDPGKLPRVGASHVLASGTHGYGRQLKSGDVVGIAIDQDQQLAYVHLNGAWQTGRPGSGVGLSLADGGSFFTADVSGGEKFVILPEHSTAYAVPAGYLVSKVPEVR